MKECQHVNFAKWCPNCLAELKRIIQGENSTKMKKCPCPCHDNNSEKIQSKCHECNGTGEIQS